MGSTKVTAPYLVGMKQRGEKIVFVTCYDATSAQIVEEASVDVILVGDSVGNVISGYSTTLNVDLEEMGYHTRAVRRGSDSTFIVADLPFGSYQSSPVQAVDSAVYLMKQGANAVKLEGEEYVAIERIHKAGIPVMGHLGFTPQSVHSFGGHKVQGKTDESAQKMLIAAQNLQKSGAFAVVLELVPSEVARQISSNISIPTIGIGAGPDCDGQVQVWHDLLGLSPRKFKHAKQYVQGRSQILEALRSYTEEVKNGAFPQEENSF
jgi:3-methyl-2-oxobutanoate hydroxymethyltransferase